MNKGRYRLFAQVTYRITDSLEQFEVERHTVPEPFGQNSSDLSYVYREKNVQYPSIVKRQYIDTHEFR